MFSRWRTARAPHAQRNIVFILCVCPMLSGLIFTKYQQLLLWLYKHFQGWGVQLGSAGCPAWSENKLFISEGHVLYLAGKVFGVVCLVLAQCLLINIIGRWLTALKGFCHCFLSIHPLLIWTGMKFRLRRTDGSMLMVLLSLPLGQFLFDAHSAACTVTEAQITSRGCKQG